MRSPVYGSVRTALAAAVLVCGGCVCNDGVCVGTMAVPETLFIARAGEPVTITTLNPTECGVRSPMSAVTSVLDPSIMPIMATVSTPRVVSGDGFAADVTFTPKVAGQYHVVVRFEPNFGQAEADVIVAADRRDAGSVASSCARGDFTPGGIALCYRGNGADTIGASVVSFDGVVARSGGTLWVVNHPNVRRWVEDGGVFELTQTGQVAEQISRIVPSADSALFINIFNQLRWWVDGGSVSTPISLPTHNAIWLRGTNVVTVRPGTSGMGTSGSHIGSCLHSLISDAGPRCSDIALMLAIVGASHDGIAVERTLMTGAGEALIFDNTGGTSLRLPPGWNLGPVDAMNLWDTGAVLSFTGGGPPDGGPYVLRRTPNGIILEDYGPDVRAVTSTCVTTGTRLIRR